jgi:flagellar motor switch protein FliN/FliY
METNTTQDLYTPESDNAAASQTAKPPQPATAKADLGPPSGDAWHGNLDFVLDIPMKLTVELGRSQMLINELLKLGCGSVVELSKLAGEPLDILANQRLIARGEVVVVNEKYGIRITEIISPAERVEKLR